MSSTCLLVSSTKAYCTNQISLTCSEPLTATCNTRSRQTGKGDWLTVIVSSIMCTCALSAHPMHFAANLNQKLFGVVHCNFQKVIVELTSLQWWSDTVILSSSGLWCYRVLWSRSVQLCLLHLPLESTLTHSGYSFDLHCEVWCVHIVLDTVVIAPQHENITD